MRKPPARLYVVCCSALHRDTSPNTYTSRRAADDEVRRFQPTARVVVYVPVESLSRMVERPPLVIADDDEHVSPGRDGKPKPPAK